MQLKSPKKLNGRPVPRQIAKEMRDSMQSSNMSTVRNELSSYNVTNSTQVKGSPQRFQHYHATFGQNGGDSSGNKDSSEKKNAMRQQ